MPPITRTLKMLIDAGASAPWAAGEGFLNHVNNSEIATKMSDYIISSMDFSGDVPAPELTYNSGVVFNEAVAFTEGPKARFIRRLGNLISTSMIGSPPGQSVTSTSNVVENPATGSTLDVTVVAAANVGTFARTCWFVGYTSPNKPPSTPESVQIRFNHTMTGGGGGGTQLAEWNVNYTPDLAGFNPMITVAQQALMNKRNDSLSNWEYEWNTNIDHKLSNRVATTQSYDRASVPQQSHTLYSRRRPVGSGGSWTDMGEFIFVDTRPLA